MTILFHDDFTEGLRVRTPEARPDGPWSLRPAGALTAGDGITRGTDAGLVVEPTGTAPGTGHPAFVVPPGSEPLDHLRWAAFGPACPTGGATLTVSATLSAEPLGEAADDIRDGAGALVVLDRDAGLILDFALTGGRVWALYGRVPGPDGTRGGFSYSVPLAPRGPWTRTAARSRWTRRRPWPAGTSTALRCSPWNASARACRRRYDRTR